LKGVLANLNVNTRSEMPTSFVKARCFDTHKHGRGRPAVTEEGGACQNENQKVLSVSIRSYLSGDISQHQLKDSLTAAEVPLDEKLNKMISKH